MQCGSTGLGNMALKMRLEDESKMTKLPPTVGPTNDPQFRTTTAVGRGGRSAFAGFFGHRGNDLIRWGAFSHGHTMLI